MGQEPRKWTQINQGQLEGSFWGYFRNSWNFMIMAAIFVGARAGRASLVSTPKDCYNNLRCKTKQFHLDPCD